jgi:hypothetical protein
VNPTQVQATEDGDGLHPSSRRAGLCGDSVRGAGECARRRWLVLEAGTTAAAVELGSCSLPGPARERAGGDGSGGASAVGSSHVISSPTCYSPWAASRGARLPADVAIRRRRCASSQGVRPPAGTHPEIPPGTADARVERHLAVDDERHVGLPGGEPDA